MVDFYRLSELVHRKDRNGTGSFALFIACTGKDGGKSPKKKHTPKAGCVR
ncbi:hypothetical protein [Pseudoramibacter alactolyticus]|nr:hypothetical protein [Pseudoramibacter alactolyticus]MBM6969210.1 hypothetical protein [Pseudoramibacter alactolyticus]